MRRFSQLLEYAISAQARFLQFASLERKSHPLRRTVRLMNRKVTPPNSTVTPQMMVLICLIHAQGQLGKLLLSARLIHNVYGQYPTR